MALQISELPRVFKYNSVDLPDPGATLSADAVRELYSATYPEILNAAIEGPDEKDGKLVYTFRRAVGTKGAKHPYRTNAHLALHLIAKAAEPVTAHQVSRDAFNNYGVSIGSAACSFLFANELVARKRNERGQFIYTASIVDATTTIEDVNSIKISNTKRVGPPRPRPASEPAAAREGLPGKPECLEDYRTLKGVHGDKLTRRLFIKKAKTGRRYEKLWPNWEKLETEAQGSAHSKRASASDINLKDVEEILALLRVWNQCQDAELISIVQRRLEAAIRR